MSAPRRPPPPAGAPWEVPLDEADLVFADLEMTGLDATADRVLEVCLVRVRGGQVVDQVETLVRPDDERSGNVHVHGIDAAALVGAPTFAEIAARVLALLDGAVLVAHGAKWDVAFLEAELGRAGRPTRFSHYLDTLTLSRRCFAFASHALGALARELGVDPGRAHRAGDDVRVLRAVFGRVVAELRPESARDLWDVEIGTRRARPAVIEVLVASLALKAPVRLRYRPSGKPPEELRFVVTRVATDLDPPRVFGYQLPGRGRRELRADRILAALPEA